LSDQLARFAHAIEEWQRRRLRRYFIQLQHYATAQLLRKVFVNSLHNGGFVVGRDEEIQIIGIIRSITNKPQRRYRLTVSVFGSRA
jgi:predicted phage-related endonuclease